ncbi:TPA: antitermination protein, partial [Yersinia enterocolitica]|nr:antitermination protein [Yersinia enterocolitica]HEF7237012.1 antitermination protein [Yersinia enterocolitica]
MRLESITKHFFAKSTMISDSPRATASDSLTGTDIMAALGLADLKSGFGLELFLAKQGISNPHRAVESLTQYALKESVKYKAISKLDED